MPKKAIDRMGDDLINAAILINTPKASLHSGRLFNNSHDSEKWIRAELRAIYNHAPAMLCTLDTNRYVVYANRAFCNFTGMSENQLLKGRACGVFGCINAFDDPRGCGFGSKCAECKLSIAIDDTLKTGRKHKNIPYRASLMRHRSCRQVVMLGSIVRISVGGKFRLLLCLQDITEFVRIEQSLRESEARLSAIFKHSMAGILLTAPGGRVFAANPSACQLLGRTEKEICGLQRSDLVDNKDSRIDALLKKRSKHGHATGEINFIRADGTRLPVQIASAVFETAKGPRTSMVFLDISERRQAEERIHHFTQKLLAVREEEKRHLSTTLHHEVGSAVIGVAARLNAAEDDLAKGLVKEALASINECRKVFEQATAKLKELAVELRPPDLDLLGLGASLRRFIDGIVHETPLIIHFTDTTLSEELSPEQQILLYRAAQECLNNVIKHANAQNVHVRLSRVRQQIQLSIADNGKGFNPGNLTAMPPSHLGLRSIQEMAAALKGRLDIVSRPKKGTKMIITIPCMHDKRRLRCSK
jgi:PAS domain S-box-containing protein